MTTQQQQEQRQGPFASFAPDEDEPVRHPPWFIFGLAWCLIIQGLLANCWQVITTVIALFALFSIGTLKGPSYVGVFLISVGMAVSFQLGLLSFAFRVHTEMKKVTIDGHKVKDTAVAMMQNHRLITFWAVVCFTFDTVGDFTFINLLTNNSFLIFAYAAALYASSTIMLSKGLEKHWAASIAYQKFRAFVLATETLAAKHAQQQAKAAANGR